MKRVFALVLTLLLAVSLAACGKKPAADAGKQVDLAAFAQSVTEAHEFSGFLQRVDLDDPDLGELMAQSMDNYYPGLVDLDLEQLEVYMSMISFSSGELALVQAKDADGAAAAMDILQARVAAKSTDGPGNYPGEVEMWLRNAKVTSNGNYVMMVCAEDSEAIVGEFDALFQ